MFCNNDCIMCKDYKTGKNYNFSYDELIKKVSDLISEDEGIHDYKIVIGGGEPTIYPRIFDLIQFLRDSGFNEIAIHTNGRRLSDYSFAKRLIESGIKAFLVSFHSHISSVSRKISQKEKSFEETLDGIANLAGFKNEIILNISHVMQNLNYKFLPDFASFMSSFTDIDLIVLSYVETRNHDIMVDFGQLKPYLDSAIEIFQENHIDFAINNLPPCVFVGSEKHYFDRYKKNHSIKGISTGIASDHSINFYCIQQMKGQFCYSAKCESCTYRRMCQGILRTYYDRFKDSSINPVSFFYAKRVLDKIEIKTLNCF